MNTQEKSFWIEPVKSPAADAPAALLEPNSGPEIEIREPDGESRVFFQPHPHPIEDMGGNELTPLDDW